jgi:elongation factor P
LPDQVVAELVDADEAVQGDTVSAIQKNAWLASGFKVLVPNFIKKGEKVLINTSTGLYAGRYNK